MTPICACSQTFNVSTSQWFSLSTRNSTWWLPFVPAHKLSTCQPPNDSVYLPVTPLDDSHLCLLTNFQRVHLPMIQFIYPKLHLMTPICACSQTFNVSTSQWFSLSTRNSTWWLPFVPAHKHSTCPPRNDSVYLPVTPLDDPHLCLLTNFERVHLPMIQFTYP